MQDHLAGERHLRHEVADKGDEGEGAGVRVLHDFDLAGRLGVARKGVGHVSQAVEVDAARYAHGDKRVSHALQKIRELQGVGKRKPGDLSRPHNRAHEHEGAHEIAHVGLFPAYLGHGYA